MKIEDYASMIENLFIQYSSSILRGKDKHNASNTALESRIINGYIGIHISMTLNTHPSL